MWIYGAMRMKYAFLIAVGASGIGSRRGARMLGTMEGRFTGDRFHNRQKEKGNRMPSEITNHGNGRIDWKPHSEASLAESACSGAPLGYCIRDAKGRVLKTRVFPTSKATVALFTKQEAAREIQQREDAGQDQLRAEPWNPNDEVTHGTSKPKETND